MRISARHIGKVTILDLSGKITMGGEELKLRDAVNGLMEEGRRNILLNLNGISFVDSAGLGELVACYKRAQEKKASLKLLNATGKVLDVLVLTKLHTVFEIFRDEQDALATF
jgi:anti-sigma B factor antagonist